MRVSKEGYYTPKQQQISFDYAGFWEANYHNPDPHNPVVFHIRKKHHAEILSSGEIRPTIPPNGTPVRFDLLNGGKVSPDGQLEIAAVTNTEKYPPRIFNWRATISVPDGGLIEHNAEFPFEAPESGYQPSVEFDMSTNVPDWKRLIEKSYFIEFGSPPRVRTHPNSTQWSKSKGLSKLLGESKWFAQFRSKLKRASFLSLAILRLCTHQTVELQPSRVTAGITTT